MEHDEPTGADDEPAPTADETVDAILATAGRGRTPLRHSFLQQGSQRDPAPGPLKALVTSGNQRAILLYMLAKAKASAKPWDVSLPASVWACALGLGHLDGRAAAVAISRLWKHLEAQKLVRRDRSGRSALIHMLTEDGSGNPYSHPGQMGDRYLQVPNALWQAGPGDERWYRVLALPEITVLLIALSLREEFWFPAERAPAWYGISADTASRGLGRLVDRGLLKVVKNFKATPLSPVNYTEHNVYTLQDPFGPKRSP